MARKGMVQKAVARNGRYRIWYGIRALGRFTLRDLVANSEAGKDNVKDYLHGLARFGYLAVVRPNRGGHLPALYQLVRNTGPYPPRLGKRGLYDPNTKELIAGGGDGSGSGMDKGPAGGMRTN